MAIRDGRWRRRFRCLAAAVVGLVVILVGSCTSTVAPPAAPANPIAVFILRDAMHVGVVLPVRRGATIERYVEYGYGDWSWYALGNDAWYRVFPTILWPTAGALSRREFEAVSAADLRRVASWVELDELIVDAEDVVALQTELERRCIDGSTQRVWRADLRMAFVPAEADYWFACTCADVAAEWLRRLRCQVGWALIRGSLKAMPTRR